MLHLVQDAPYRRMYHSAVVVDKNAGIIKVIKNVEEGVVKATLTSSQDQLYRVHYTIGKYSPEEVVKRATQRLVTGERRYHPLLNNSHHFATWCISERENSLYTVLQNMEHRQDNSMFVSEENESMYSATPALFKKSLETITELKIGDHVFKDGQNWIVESIDDMNGRFMAYTYSMKDKRVKKQSLDMKGVSIISYDEVMCTLRNPSDVIRDARIASSLWKGDDEFATFLKTGKQMSFSYNSLIDVSFTDDGFQNEGIISCTKVTSDICIEEGDHLVLRKDSEQDCHVIVCYVEDNHSLIVTPSANELTQRICISDYSDVYRINYKCSLPGETVARRVLCDKGRQYFCDLSNPEVQCKLLTWAKVGKPQCLSQLPRNQVIVDKCPFRYERVVSMDEINVGDHLFEPTSLYWFHYLVTEKNGTQLSIIYQLQTKVIEVRHYVDIRHQDVYKVIYPECFPAEKSIQRARMFISGRNYHPEGRMKFVCRAKTGSEDGVFVDVLFNYSLPTSKSEIYSFTQLNPGDYLAYKEGKWWHHCLVQSVSSPSTCHIYELWSSNVTAGEMTWNDNFNYYRLNYNKSVCIKVEQSLALAAEAVTSSKGLKHQLFVQRHLINQK